MKRFAVVLTALSLLVACAHWQSHGLDSESGAASVRLIESGPLPANCRLLGPVTASRGALQDASALDLKLRNAAVEMHGNLVLVTSRSTLSAQGEVHSCSESPPPSATPQMINVSHVTPAHSSRASTTAPQQARGGIEEDTLDARARELFVLGRDAYLQERFEEAFKYFNAAYELSGRYELQYNIGQTADKLHRSAEALMAFERFLQFSPLRRARCEPKPRLASPRYARVISSREARARTAVPFASAPNRLNGLGELHLEHDAMFHAPDEQRSPQ
jgi:tetratricopeptide (TPR) repeat protein